MSDLAVIVVSWNTRELLLSCLETLERVLAEGEPLAAEICVVDNGSRDGSADAVRERFPTVCLIELAENRGYAAGNNAALARVGGDSILLLNTDVRITRAALDRCLAALRDDPAVGAAGPELQHPDGRPQNTIHPFPGLATELVPARLREALLPARFPSKRRRYEQPIDVEALRGAALFVRRAAVDAIGPLCEDYFFFLEETDWCWRLRRGGWRVRLVPGAPVVHLLGASSKRRQPALTRIEYHRSLYRFLREHRGHAVALAVAVLRAARLLGSVLLLAAPAAASAPARARLVERFQVLLWHLRGCPAGAGLAALDGGPRTREASPAPEAGKQEARANASAKGCA